MLSKPNQGFTVIELIIALFIFAIVVLFTHQIFGTQYRFFLSQQEFSDLQSQMTASLKLATLDLKELGADPSGANLFFPLGGIQALEVDPVPSNGLADDIRIFSDRNGDGNVGGLNEDITYRFVSTPGNKRLLRNGLTIATNVASLSFRFFDENGTEMPFAAAQANQHLVTLVKVVLELEHEVPGFVNGRYLSRAMTASARLYNR